MDSHVLSVPSFKSYLTEQRSIICGVKMFVYLAGDFWVGTLTCL